MAKVYLSGLAKQDLSDAKRYISEELQNPEAAKRVLARIFKSLRVLEQFPYSGTPLQITGIETGYRSVASGSYRIFYHGDEESVYVVRILYGRRDFMRILFGVTSAPDDEE